MIGVEDKPGTAFRIFNTLAKNHINVDIILQSVGRDGTKDISFTVASDDLEDVYKRQFGQCGCKACRRAKACWRHGYRQRLESPDQRAGTALRGISKRSVG